VGCSHQYAKLDAVDLAERLVGVLAADRVEQLGGGHQSQVFKVIDHAGAVSVAKVVEASAVARHELNTRLEVIGALADLDPRVYRPLSIGRRRVAEVELADDRFGYVVRFEFADGVAPDPANGADAQQMGTVLGQEDVVSRVFELDDSGYGPPAFDVANALYMVLFYAFTRGAAEIYDTFRPLSLAGYTGASGSALCESTLETFIGLRVRALGVWLDDLDTAPTGIAPPHPPGTPPCDPSSRVTVQRLLDCQPVDFVHRLITLAIVSILQRRCRPQRGAPGSRSVGHTHNDRDVWRHIRSDTCRRS
jgi:Ser/Thr protein kinase RdoA (MazF antagonist)